MLCKGPQVARDAGMPMGKAGELGKVRYLVQACGPQAASVRLLQRHHVVARGQAGNPIEFGACAARG